MNTTASSSCYCVNLRRGANVLTDIYDAALKKAGLTLSQYSLLANLDRMGEANISQWADCVGLERTTMVRNAKALEALGLINRMPGRGKVWTPSPRGRALLEAARPTWVRCQAAVARTLGDEDAEALLRISAKLQDLRDALNTTPMETGDWLK